MRPLVGWQMAFWQSCNYFLEGVHLSLSQKTLALWNVYRVAWTWSPMEFGVCSSFSGYKWLKSRIGGFVSRLLFLGVEAWGSWEVPFLYLAGLAPIFPYGFFKTSMWFGCKWSMLSVFGDSKGCSSLSMWF